MYIPPKKSRKHYFSWWYGFLRTRMEKAVSSLIPLNCPSLYNMTRAVEGGLLSMTEQGTVQITPQINNTGKNCQKSWLMALETDQNT